MEAAVLERLLRELPGVLDCSVTDEGVAIVVHPEVDPRIIELRAKALLGDVDETKPLLVVGGMTSGAPVLPPPERRARARARGGRSPLSATGVVVLVLALLFVVPITGRDASSDRDPDTPAPTPPTELAAPLPSPAPALPAAVPELAETAPAATPASSAPVPTPVVATTAPPPEPVVALVAEEAEAPVPTFAAAGVDSPSFEVVKLKKKHTRADIRREREPTTKATPGKSGRRKATGLRKR